MKKPATFLLLFFISVSFVFAQQSIKGKVVNSENGQAVAGASVFISNTSKGTVTNTTGDFVLNDIPAGRHELIVSYIGYETFAQTFSGDQLPMQQTIKLELKVKELEGVTVSPFEKDGWAKWGKTFLENFMGTGENSGGCKISNYKSIRFRYSKKDNILTALSPEPLIVINKALGYKVQYQLEDFQVDFNKHMMVYFGYPLFEELKGSKKRFQRMRNKAYNGSIMHFIRSLYDNKVQQDGFEVKRLKKVPNIEKIRVKEVFRVVEKTEVNPKTGEKVLVVGYDRDRFSKDSVSYYERILGQKDVFDVYSDYLIAADSLVASDNNGVKYLSFPDYIAVTYKNELEERKFLESIMEGNRKSFYQRSALVLTEGTVVVIEVNGNYYDPQNLFSMGYWAWSEKVENLLPFDYEPGE